MKNKFIKTYLISVGITLLLIFLDQLSKFLIEAYINKGSTIDVIGDFFQITKVYNTGAAWSMGANSTIILALISFVATIFASYYMTKNDFKVKPLYSAALIMIVAGAYGNFYDRFMTVIDLRPGVIDFLQFNFGSYTFPIFNLADIFLVVGVITLMVDILFFEDRRKKNAKDL